MIEIGGIKEQQRKWAESEKIQLDKDNYVRKMDENFFMSLCDETLRDLKGGDGSEISDDNIRTKIYATHSSSALVCNFFEYWRFREKKDLAYGLKLKKGIKTLSFEQKLSMGMRGRMPNLDIFMILEDGQALAIESKYTEWNNKKTKQKPFADSYFERDRWNEVGLPNCQILAKSIRKKNDFKYLNAPQLLKHALGLANMLSNQSELMYLYYDHDIKSQVSLKHKVEINRFSDAMKGELNFSALTYQELFNRLQKRDDLGIEYRNYLESRYFTA